MKKIFSIALVLLVMVSSLAACDTKTAENAASAPDDSKVPAENPQYAVEDDGKDEGESTQSAGDDMEGQVMSLVDVIKEAGILTDEEFKRFEATEKKLEELYTQFDALKRKESLTDEESNKMQQLQDEMDKLFESEKDIYDKVDKYLEDNGMMMAEGEDGMPEDQPITKDLSSFSATDQNGNTVTQDVFKDKDITMVNIWATWCGPCVDELGELQKLYESLGKNVGMITICEDMDMNKEQMLKILEDKGCTFTTLAPDSAIRNGLLSQVQCFPTTIFVGKNGKLVGEPIYGAPMPDAAKAYGEEIDARLNTIGQ